MDNKNKKKTSLEVSSGPKYVMAWNLNSLCNFRCEYCFCSKESLSKEHPDVGKYSPGHIAGCFDNTGKTWRIHMSGGEPFVYPDYVTLTRLLTKNHYISINTNLSTGNVFQFGDAVPPGKVLTMNAGIHILEREKKKDGVSKYIEKFLYLQDKGFNIRLEYVAYPPLFSRLKKDMAFFASQGVKIVNLKMFRGTYNGKVYPHSYTEEEKEIISQKALDTREMEIMNENVNFYRRLCSAGETSFNMDPSGNLFRCLTVKECYGNFFSSKFRMDKKPRPCPAKKCGCPYEGIRLIKDKKASPVSLFLGKGIRKIKKYLGKV